MEDDYFGKAVDDLKVPAGSAQEYQVGRAQVHALLPVASSLGDVAGELKRLRHLQGDWSE